MNFQTYGSKCPICSERISSSRIRVNGGIEAFVDTELWDFIKKNFPDEVEKKMNGNVQDTVDSVGKGRKVVPPDEGELQNALEKLQRGHDEDRLNEEKENERKLLEFLEEQNMAEEKRKLEIMKKDQELANKLQLQLQSKPATRNTEKDQRIAIEIFEKETKERERELRESEQKDAMLARKLQLQLDALAQPKEIRQPHKRAKVVRNHGKRRAIINVSPPSIICIDED